MTQFSEIEDQNWKIFDKSKQGWSNGHNHLSGQ